MNKVKTETWKQTPKWKDVLARIIDYLKHLNDGKLDNEITTNANKSNNCVGITLKTTVEKSDFFLHFVG